MLQWFFDLLFSGPRVCRGYVPDSPHAALYAALVCGTELRGERELWIETGLIHLLVVSGAHLHFVERLWRRRPGLPLVLGAYAWLTGFGAPVLRALLRRTLQPRLDARALSSLQIEALTSALLLLAYPPWWTSRSFLMCWMCSLALGAAEFSARAWRPLWRALSCYIFLLPFTGQNPVTVLWNLLLAPWMGGVLFPAALIAFAAPLLVPFTDAFWTLTLMTLKLGPRQAPLDYFIPASWLWVLPLVLQVVLLVCEVKWRRAVAFAH